MQVYGSTGLSKEEELRLIQRGGAAHVGFGADLLDMNLNFIRKVPILGGSVTRSHLANIHGTCNLELAEDIDYGNQLVMPWQSLRIGKLIGRWNLGPFSLTTPDENFGRKPYTRSARGYDRLYLLAREVGDTWVAPQGAKVLSEVRRAIAAAGLTGILLDGSKQDVTLETEMVWPLVRAVEESDPFNQTKRERSTGLENAVTYLRIVNDLLFAIGYRGLYADPATGLFRSEPYILPEKRTPEFLFDFNDPQHSIVVPQRTRATNTFKSPNHWVFVRQNMPGNPPPVPTVANGGVYIVDKVGWDGRKLKWSQQIPLDVATNAALIEQGNNRVAADMRKQTTLKVAVAPFPLAGHGDIYEYRDKDMGATVRVQSKTHTIDLRGGNVPMDWEVVA